VAKREFARGRWLKENKRVRKGARPIKLIRPATLVGGGGEKQKRKERESEDLPGKVECGHSEEETGRGKKNLLV